MSTVWTISKQNTVAGRGIVATKKIEAGEPILKLERPSLLALDAKYLPEVCSYCFRFNTSIDEDTQTPQVDHVKVKACSGCKTVQYCSKPCQAASWKLDHKKYCKALQKIPNSDTLTSEARTVIQLIMEDEPMPMAAMVVHLDQIAQCGGERYAKLQALSTGVFHYTGNRFGLAYVQWCFAMMQTNSFTLTSATFDPIGIAWDARAAMFNHSCEPNAFVVFDGPQMSFRALKSIEVGKEILISYIDVTNPVHRRQKEITSKYFFVCNCAKCRLGPTEKEDRFLKSQERLPLGLKKDISVTPGSFDNWGSADADDTNYVGDDSNSAVLEAQQWLAFDKLASSTKISGAAATGAASGQNKASLKLLKEGLQACFQTKIWPECRQPIPSLRQQLFVELLNPAFDGLSWSYAFRQGLKLYFGIHPVVYPQTFHPGRVIHKWTLAKLALFLADPPTRVADELKDVDFGVVTIGLLIEVQDNVKQSHGTDSAFARTVRRKLDEVTVDMTRGDERALQKIKEKIENQWRSLRQLAISEDADNWMSLI